MPVFLSSLKKKGHLEQIHLTLGVIGSRKVRGQDDFGSQSWNIFAPSLTIYGFDADEDACITANTDLEQRQINWKEKHFPLALSNLKSESTLYVTKSLESSSLYEPNTTYLQRFFQLSELLEVAFTIEVETTTLDSFCQSEQVEQIDFLQIDAQGAELPILQGSLQILQNSVLAIHTEVSFSPIYLNQPLFADVDFYLRDKGFTLFDLSAAYYKRSRSPIAPRTRPGQLIWGECIYFRDFLGGRSPHLNQPENLLKLACIADILDFPDYTLEILEYLTLQYGRNSDYNFADSIVESLAQIPELLQQGLEILPVITNVKEYLSQESLNLIRTREI
ncbi:FkbM family methyltransferase [Trichocoleus desertorum AS-A10]|uniref:FkbM family methyltransferase n=1 Tax=Trichocoleus desertorum TaxID=1481672 RepID=UPI003296996A